MFFWTLPGTEHFPEKYMFWNNCLTITRSDAYFLPSNKAFISSQATCCVLLLALILLQRTRNIFYFFKWKDVHFRIWGTYRQTVGVRQKKNGDNFIPTPSKHEHLTLMKEEDFSEHCRIEINERISLCSPLSIMGWNVFRGPQAVQEGSLLSLWVDELTPLWWDPVSDTHKESAYFQSWRKCLLGSNIQWFQIQC